MLAHHTALVAIGIWVTLCASVWLTLVPRTLGLGVFLIVAALLFVIGAAAVLVWPAAATEPSAYDVLYDEHGQRRS